MTKAGHPVKDGIRGVSRYLLGIQGVKNTSVGGKRLVSSPTPCNNGGLDHHVRIEDFDQFQVEVGSLHAHPGHGGHGKVVDQDGSNDASPAGGRLLDTGKEDQIQKEQGAAETNQDAAPLQGSQGSWWKIAVISNTF